MNILVDTHSLLWFLTKNPSLSQKAKHSIEQSQIIYIPTIVLLEFLYLLQKKGQRKKFAQFLRELKENNRYTIIAVDVAVVEEIARNFTNLEMHDHVIVASAEILKVAIVTKDRKISHSYTKIIW